MAIRDFESGPELLRWAFWFTVFNALAAIPLAVLYVYSIVPFDAARFRLLMLTLAGVIIVALGIARPAVAWLCRPMVRYLDRSRDVEPDPGLVADALAAVVALPTRVFVIACTLYFLGGLAIIVVMNLLVASFTGFASFSIMVAASSAGIISQVLYYARMKAGLSRLRGELVAGVSDVEVRNRVVRTVPVASKLAVSMLGVLMVTLVFSLSLAQVRTTARGDQEWFELGEGLLRRFEEGARAGRPMADVLESVTRWLPEDAITIHLIDPRLASARALEAETGIAADDIHWVLDHPEGGDSHDLITDERFIWTTPGPESPIVLVHVPRRASAGTMARVVYDYGILSAVSLFVTLGVAYLMGRDIRASSRALRSEVDRVADGDLSLECSFESEDEFGGLARSISRMSRSLRDQVSRIALLATDMEGVASRALEVTSGIVHASQSQSQDAEHASSAMEVVRDQVLGISEAVDSVATSVESSSAAITQIGSSSNDLSRSSESLSERITSVAESAERMAASISAVAARATGLGESASRTSESMEEMAASVRLIDAATAETAKLAARVMESAEEGRGIVDGTNAGMREIESATGSVEEAVAHLVTEAERIGEILSVIESVADETGLLALNAAIIAAQSGDHGRGFKVVADQVKSLAGRVLESTMEVSDLINSVREDSQNAERAIKESTKRVGEGVSLTEGAKSSLEEISRLATQSGQRLDGVVESVRGHSDSALAVVELMDKVNDDAEAIMRTGEGQQEVSRVVMQSSRAMSEIAVLLRDGTAEQARSIAEIRGNVAAVQRAIDAILAALRQQNDQSTMVAEFLERVREGSKANELGAGELGQAMSGLHEEAARLRASIAHFKLGASGQSPGWSPGPSPGQSAEPSLGPTEYRAD